MILKANELVIKNVSLLQATDNKIIGRKLVSIVDGSGRMGAMRCFEFKKRELK